MNPSPARLDVVDALRGFAIVSIMLLHNIEHFDLYHRASGLPEWMVALDKVIWDSAFFLFGGKSYAIFALLFGVTFHIQFSRRAAQGEDFRARFAWRLLLLFAFGMVNSLFYHGDILTIYALVGFLLIPFARLGNKAVFALACVLMAQPYEWWMWLQAQPITGDPASWAYFGRAKAYLTGDSLMAVWAGNLTNGKPGAFLWSWENGRFFQILALFMLGMLAGRQGRFTDSPQQRRFWGRVLALAAIAFIPLYLHKSGLPRHLDTMIGSWSNLAFMLVLVSSFVLLYWRAPLARCLAPLGRMSLTSYVSQSLAGSFIYYGYGLGLYAVTGATWCLLIGVVLALLQGAFSAWWLRRHSMGPLEALWHRATWLGRRQPRAGGQESQQVPAQHQ